MIILIKIFVLSLFVVFFNQADNSRSILHEVQEKYNTINNFTSNFVLMTANGGVNTGKFTYKSDDKFRIETKSRTIVGDGKSTWTFTPKNNQVVISPVDDNTNSFSIRDYLYEYPEQCTVSTYENEDGTYTLILKPKTSELEFKEVRLIVNSQKLINQIELTDLMNNIYNVTLENTRINQNIDDKLFIFEIPEGARVIDLR